MIFIQSQVKSLRILIKFSAKLVNKNYFTFIDLVLLTNLLLLVNKRLIKIKPVFRQNLSLGLKSKLKSGPKKVLSRS